MYELTPKENAILKTLATKGYKTSYDLYKKHKIAAASTVWKAIGRLTAWGLVEVKHEERFKKIPSKTKLYYGLTFRGLVSALKVEGVKIHLVKNKEKLISAWMETVSDVDSTFKIRRQFKINQDWSSLEGLILNHLEANPEEIEAFLRHYDLEHCDNHLIFFEWVNFVVVRTTASRTFNRAKRRQLKQIVQKLPESYQALFIIPELWGVQNHPEKGE